MIFPLSEVSSWFDLIGSILVATYLIYCGIKTVYDANRRNK